MMPALGVFAPRPAIKVAPVVGRLRETGVPYPVAVIENALRLIDVPQARKAMMVERPPYGDGQPADRIVQALANRYPGGSDEFEQAS